MSTKKTKRRGGGGVEKGRGGGLPKRARKTSGTPAKNTYQKKKKSTGAGNLTGILFLLEEVRCTVQRRKRGRIDRKLWGKPCEGYDQGKTNEMLQKFRGRKREIKTRNANKEKKGPYNV